MSNFTDYFGIKKADGSLRRYIVVPGKSYAVWDRHAKVNVAEAIRRLDKALAMMRTLNREGN